MKDYFFECYFVPIPFFIFFIFFISSMISPLDFLKAEESNLTEMQIDSSTKSDEKNSSLPTNPFEIVEMIRKANSMNDATNPSDAIDEALKTFKMVDEKEKI